MNKYKNKKVAILRGYPRLIDGESTSVDEMYLWGKKNDVEIETYYMHKVWKRKKPKYNDGYSHSYKIFNREEIEEVTNEINENYDLVILINPAKPHSGLTKEDVLKFHKMYKDITVTKVQMQHTSFKKAINETPFCWSYINESDAVFNHSDKSWYMESLVKALPSKRTRAFPMHLWTDVDKYKEYYKNEDRDVECTYIGRFVLYKGPKRLLTISPALLHNGIKSSIYGMDTSIGCKSIILDHENCNNLLQPNAERNSNPIVDTYGRIERSEVMEKFNKSLFACTLFKFKKEIDKTFYGDRLEYTMQEAIMAGSILVVDKEWATICKTVDGTRFIDIPNFAVYMDEDFPGDAIKRMKEIAEDKELQKLYRDTAFEVLRKEYDSKVVLPDLFNTLFSLTKDPYKFESDYELVKYLTKSDKLASEFNKLYDEGYLLPMTSANMGENKISVFSGKTGKAIKEYEI